MIGLREINNKIEPCYCDGDDDDDNKSSYCSAASSPNIGWETETYSIRIRETIVSMGTLGFNKFGVHTMCKYEIRSGTNTISPNLSKWDDRAKCQFSMGKKYDLASKQIQITISPNLSKWESHPLTLRTFFDTLWWTWVKKGCCGIFSMYMGGIISCFLQVLCPRSDSIWPLLFLHPLSGGCRTRLRIRSKSK